MSDYLVARLRSTRKWDINAISPVYADLACEAADEIERLYRSMLVEHAEVERLKAVMDDPLNSGEWHNPDDLVRIRELEAAGRAVLACTDKVCGLPDKCFKHCEADAMLRAVLPTGDV